MVKRFGSGDIILIFKENIVTGWYPWVITRETLALQPYERSTPTRRMRRQNGFAGSHGHYYSVLKGHLSAPVR